MSKSINKFSIENNDKTKINNVNAETNNHQYQIKIFTIKKNQESNVSIEINGKFCSCSEDCWTFSEVKSYILLKQKRSCPFCNQTFQGIQLEEKPLNIYSFIFSFDGLLMIIYTFFHSYNFLFYLTFLAFVDIYISHLSNIPENYYVESSIYTFMTIVFCFIIIYLFIQSILIKAINKVHQCNYKKITNVYRQIDC